MEKQKLPCQSLVFCGISTLLALFAADEVYSSAHPNTGAGITSIESGAPEPTAVLL